MATCEQLLDCIERPSFVWSSQKTLLHCLQSPSPRHRLHTVSLYMHRLRSYTVRVLQNVHRTDRLRRQTVSCPRECRPPKTFLRNCFNLMKNRSILAAFCGSRYIVLFSSFLVYLRRRPLIPYIIWSTYYDGRYGNASTRCLLESSGG